MTPEERSLAAAMRWQDELTSRGCLPGPDRAPSPLLSLANFDPGQLALLLRSDSKLLAAAAAAQARATVPTSSPLAATECVPAVDTAETSHQGDQADTTYHDRYGTPLRIIKTDNAPSVQAEEDPQHMSGDQVDVSSQQSASQAKGGWSESTQRQSAPDMAQLARLPSAKGHCLMSYPNARPQSPIKHPSTQGDLLNGVHASKMLSVRPFGVQSQRPSTAAAILDAAARSKSELADTCGSVDSCENMLMAQSSEGRHPAVLRRSSQPQAVIQTGALPDSKPPSGHVVAQTSRQAADDTGTAPH